MSFGDACQIIDELVTGEQSAVSARLLSRKLNVPIGSARQWLEQYLQETKQNCKSSWVISGTKEIPPSTQPNSQSNQELTCTKDGPTFKHAIELVARDELEAAQARFASVKGVCIYAISQGDPLDATTLFEMKAQSQRLEGLYTAQKPIASNWSAEQEEVIQSLSQATGTQKSETRAPSVVAKPGSSIKSESNTKPGSSAKPGSSTGPATTGKSAAAKKSTSFFGNFKPQPAKATEPRQEKVEKDEVVIESDRESDGEEEQLPPKQLSKDMEELKTMFDDDDDEDIEMMDQAQEPPQTAMEQTAEEQEMEVEPQETKEAEPQDTMEAEPQDTMEAEPQLEPEIEETPPDQTKPEQPEKEEYIDENGLFSFDRKKKKPKIEPAKPVKPAKPPTMTIPKYDPKKREAKMKQSDIFSMFKGK